MSQSGYCSKIHRAYMWVGAQKGNDSALNSAPVEFGNSGLVLPEYENQTNILNAHAPLD